MFRPLSSVRIGYAGYSHDLRHPGDRRRFGAYAEMKGLRFERAELGGDYDVVLITHNSDIPGWLRRKHVEGDRLKLIFELVDSYMTHGNLGYRVTKGVARYLVGMDSVLGADFGRTLVRVCRVADAVLCSTAEQQLTIGAFNRKCFQSFDWFGDDLEGPKTDYQRSSRLRLVWEGQSATLANLQSIREPLNALQDRIELHVISDPVYYRNFARYRPMDSAALLHGIACPIIFHAWERDSFYRLISSADVAVIPIDPNNRFAIGKPENKLILFWMLGMPVIASATPAYKRTMDAAGLDMLCYSREEWLGRLSQLADQSARDLERIGRQGFDFASSHYDKAAFMKGFDDAFLAAGFRP